MINPFKYRPPFEHHDEEYLDWDDNWASNAIAWASERFLPLCDWKPFNWFADKMWAECSCCLFYRGVGFGLVAGVAAGLIF